MTFLVMTRVRCKKKREEKQRQKKIERHSWIIIWQHWVPSPLTSQIKQQNKFNAFDVILTLKFVRKRRSLFFFFNDDVIITVHFTNSISPCELHHKRSKCEVQMTYRDQVIPKKGSVFNVLRLQSKYWDAVIRVEGVEYKVHKIIMCDCSPYFG